MKSLIRKILNEAVKKDDIVTINGIEFVVSDYVSSHSDKSDIFLILASNTGKRPDRQKERIDYNTFLGIKNTLTNAGLKSSPQAYNTDGDKVTHVYEIRVTVDVPKIVKTYLDVVINTNTDSLFEQEENNLEWAENIGSLEPLKYKEKKVYWVDYGHLEDFIERVYGKSVEIAGMLESSNDTTHEFNTNLSYTYRTAEEIGRIVTAWANDENDDDGYGMYVGVGDILRDLVHNKGLIPDGNWAVRVSW